MKGRKVFWTFDAETDLLEVFEYILRDRPRAALKVLTAIRRRCEMLRLNPERNRIVPEFQAIGIVNYREIVFKPYRIIYKLTPAASYVIAVVDSRRDLGAFLFERLMRL